MSECDWKFPVIVVIRPDLESFEWERNMLFVDSRRTILWRRCSGTIHQRKTNEDIISVGSSSYCSIGYVGICICWSDVRCVVSVSIETCPSTSTDEPC